MNINEYKWLNESEHEFFDSTLRIYAKEKTDFFYGGDVDASTGILPQTLCNAPFLYKEIEGDFVMRALVSHGFKDVYDSSTLMVMHDERLWGKLCFEKTDFVTKAVVSVVTNGFSDDANGCNLIENEVWLQIARQGNSFAFHYSLDGTRYDMVRFFTLPVEKSIKVGFVAQAPLGDGGDRFFKNISIENITVENIREGK